MPSANQTPVPSISRATRIGWIGTGVMGQSMCGHLVAQGYPVSVYTRTQSKAEPLIEQGACWKASPKDVAEHSDIVFTMVGFPSETRDVYDGDQGILAGIRPGMILIDMGTSEPSLARDLAARAVANGAFAVDAPVSGGDVGARSATLSIMVGGDSSVVQAVKPLFEVLGQRVVYQGGPGTGQQAKLCNQIVIAGTMIGVCESLLYGYKAGLDLHTLLRSISGGAAACWTLDRLAPRMLRRDFDPGFVVDHFVKDMKIALDEAGRLGIALPGLALVHQLYRAVQAEGRGQAGTQALLVALEQLSRTEVRANAGGLHADSRGSSSRPASD